MFCNNWEVLNRSPTKLQPEAKNFHLTFSLFKSVVRLRNSLERLAKSSPRQRAFLLFHFLLRFIIFCLKSFEGIIILYLRTNFSKLNNNVCIQIGFSYFFSPKKTVFVRFSRRFEFFLKKKTSRKIEKSEMKSFSSRTN